MTKVATGTVLLEALCAIVVLGITGTAVTRLLAAQAASQSVSARHERLVNDQSRLLEGIALMTGEELRSIVPRRAIGSYVVDVALVGPSLFDVVVTHPSAGMVLSTLLYRRAE